MYGQYSRAVSNQERVIVVCVQYIFLNMEMRLQKSIGLIVNGAQEGASCCLVQYHNSFVSRQTHLCSSLVDCSVVLQYLRQTFLTCEVCFSIQSKEGCYQNEPLIIGKMKIKSKYLQSAYSKESNCFFKPQCQFLSNRPAIRSIHI